jgi:hypothetical protein
VGKCGEAIIPPRVNSTIQVLVSTHRLDGIVVSSFD